MKISVRSALSTALLFATASLLAPATARAVSAAPTTDATCVMTGHGVFATAVGAGGVDIAMPDTLSMTGTVTCVDAAGVAAAAGTFQRTVTMPTVECTGDEHGDTSTSTVSWSDGAVSTFQFTKTDVVKMSGTASLTVAGGVSADSARYANDTISAGGISAGAGCGSPVGEAALDTTLVLRLTH